MPICIMVAGDNPETSVSFKFLTSEKKGMDKKHWYEKINGKGMICATVFTLYGHL